MNRHIYTLLFTFLLVSSPTANSQSPSCKAASCIPLMLQSISPLNETQLNAAADLALNKDAFPKGNRKEARKLNEEGLKQLNSGNPQSAANTLKQAVDIDPSDVEINSNYGFALLKANNYAAAKSQLQKTLELNPRRTSTWLPLAEAYAGSGQAQIANQAGLIAYYYSSDKAKAKAYYQKQSQEQATAPIRTMYSSLVSEISKLDSGQLQTSSTKSTALTSSPSSNQAPNSTASATAPRSQKPTYEQLVKSAAGLGEDYWAKCAVANISLTALSVTWKQMPQEMIKANTVMGDLLGDIRKYYLRNGIPEQLLSSLFKKWNSTSVGSNGDVAIQTMNECISKMTTF